ncbi:hypothetical protein [Arcanobacterium phocae]|uniref:hypothetical protein n=1 Tax=Arcanobacterium phocae TaxID=131112 RepID=UPI000B8A0A9F|nr:hypothetical protein [Arcanobacterium phocae]
MEIQVPAGTWWPGESRFEIAVGTILAQNTSWRNVESAIDNLRDAGLLSPEHLLTADDETVASLIRPCGYYKAKTRYLNELTAWFIKRDQHAKHLSTPELREELLRIHGVGEETADMNPVC